MVLFAEINILKGITKTKYLTDPPDLIFNNDLLCKRVLITIYLHKIDPGAV
jgi:hypothetical protein